MRQRLAIVAVLVAILTACSSTTDPATPAGIAGTYQLTDSLANGAYVHATGSVITVDADNSYRWDWTGTPSAHTAGRWQNSGASGLLFTDTLPGRPIDVWIGSESGSTLTLETIGHTVGYRFSR